MRCDLAGGTEQREILLRALFHHEGGFIEIDGKRLHRLATSFGPIMRNLGAATASRPIGRERMKRSISKVVDNTTMNSMLLQKPWRPATRAGGVRQYCSTYGGSKMPSAAMRWRRSMWATHSTSVPPEKYVFFSGALYANFLRMRTACGIWPA